MRPFVDGRRPRAGDYTTGPGFDSGAALRGVPGRPGPGGYSTAIRAGRAARAAIPGTCALAGALNRSVR